MSFRIVIPRSIPFGDSNRAQQVAWKRGYSTRLAGRDTEQPGSQVVEFLRLVDELPDPSQVPALERDLEQLLSGKRIDAKTTGAAAWLESVQNRPVRRRSA